MVKDEHAGVGHFGGGGDFFHFASTDQGRRVRAIAPLQNLSYHHRAGACGQLTQLRKRLFGIEWHGMVFGFQTQRFRRGGLGLERLRRNARRLMGRVVIGLGSALGTGMRTAAKFDSDEKRTLRLARKTGPLSGGYSGFQGTGKTMLSDGSPLRRGGNGRGRHHG